AITVFSWGFALNSLGVVVGANLGRLTNINYGIASELTPFMVALAILLFVAYVVVIMHGFSFAKTIEGVQPDQPPVAHTDVEALENRCVEIGARYGLTARENEVFLLLARGRNGRFVQEELVVSYNTVKAHVKHIYAKIGIHTQQELIDLVENYQPEISEKSV
ncbi:MAG: helix-turn-helix transcriptional regulator, partial [Raoultibacter sp.]